MVIVNKIPETIINLQKYFNLLTTIILMILPIMANAQEPVDSLKENEKNREMGIAGKTADSLKFEIQKKHMEASGEFYKNVKTTASKNFFSRQLYPLFFKRPTMSTPVIDSIPKEIPFQKEKGKVIRSIRIYRAAVFGSSVFDTTKVSDLWIDRTLNKLHFNTRDAVIKSYLLFNKGDRIDPVVLSDNERIIRQSAIFEDARFIISNESGSDSADIMVVVRDVFPLGFDVKIRNINSSFVRVFNRNIFGFGHQIEQSFEINTKDSPAVFLSEGAYKIRNIRRTITDAVIQWQNRPEIDRLAVQVSRPFYSPETKFGGGLNFQNVTSRLISGNQEPLASLKYAVYDFWGGYSTIINRFRSPGFERSVFAITGRYYNINHMNTPSVVLQKLNPSVTLNRYILSFSLIKSSYYLNNMVYGFGQTEDIPAGRLAQLVMGYETSILNKRLYSGLRLLSGEVLKRNAFIYSWFETGGYWRNGRIEDGIVGLGAEFISRLYRSGTYRIRSFGSFSYKTGINRISPDELSISNSLNTETFRRFDVAGNQRLTAKAETVIFTPYYLFGFRFAAFTYIEAAMVVPSGEFILSGNLYPAIGFGFRIKNENLAFSTFQLGLTWYGRSNRDNHNLMFEFNDLPMVNKLRFNNEAPEFAGFE